MSDRISFRVEDELLDRLEAIAQQRGATMSAVLREAVDAFCLPVVVHERLRAVAVAEGVEVSDLIRRAVAAYLDHGPTAPVLTPPAPAVVGPVWPPRVDAEERR